MKIWDGWSCALICLMVLLATPTTGQTGAHAKALRKQLFVTNDYDKKVRTATDQLDATEAFVSFYLTNLNEVDEVKEVIRTTGYLQVYWTDDYLTWTPGDYGGLEYSYWPQDDIWKPDVALKNSYQDYKQLGDSALNVQVGSDGSVIWMPFRVFQSTCSIDITYFPYDLQSCKLEFVAWSYTKADVLMQAGTDGINLDQYQENSEWDIIGSKAEVEVESVEASVIFTLVIRRKPRYILLTVFLPVLLLTILNVFVFVLPSDSGEKSGYAVTVFLAFAVFLTIVSSTLPENSENTSVLSVYILLQTVQSTLITALALLLVRLNSLEAAIPIWLKHAVCFLQCRTCKKTKVEHSDTQAVKLDEKTIKLDEKETTTATEPEISWKTVVNCLDMLLFCSFLLFAFISTVACLVILSSSPAKLEEEFLAGTTTV